MRKNSNQQGVKPRLWDRIFRTEEVPRSEPAKAYAAARVFFEMGLDRTLAETADTSGHPYRTIKFWCEEWNWYERAKAYDEQFASYAESFSRRTMDRALAQMNEWTQRQQEVRNQFWTHGQKLIERAETMEKFPLIEKEIKREVSEDGKTIFVTMIKPARWNMKTMLDTLSLGCELSRLATGIVAGSDPVAQMIAEQGDNLPLEVLEAIAEGRPVKLLTSKNEPVFGDGSANGNESPKLETDTVATQADDGDEDTE
jgi:hypothetical protein